MLYNIDLNLNINVEIECLVLEDKFDEEKIKEEIKKYLDKSLVIKDIYSVTEGRVTKINKETMEITYWDAF